MKQTLIIKPIHSRNITLLGEYYDKANSRVLTLLTSGEVTDAPLRADQRKFYHKFMPNRPELRYEFIWLDDLKSETPLQSFKRKKEELMVEFYRNHPYINVDGLEPKPQALFTLHIVEDIVKQDYEKLKRKGLVYNTVNDADIESLRNISFMFGGNPVDKTQEEIFLELVDFNNGRLMIGNRPEEFLEKWDGNKNPDMPYLINIKKAIAYKIIETKNNNYCIANQIIGSSIEDVVAYMKGNPDTYESFVRREIQKRELSLIKQEKNEIKDKASKAFMPKAPSEKWAENIKEKEIRDKAKSLGIKSYHVKSLKTLQEEIANKEEKAAVA